MFFQFISGFLGASALLYPLAHTSPLLASLVERDTTELYIFANCINNHTFASYADIFW